MPELSPRWCPAPGGTRIEDFDRMNSGAAPGFAE